jgi:hypothetical protein
MAMICENACYEECLKLLSEAERRRCTLKRLIVLSCRAIVAFVCLLGSFGHLFEPDLDYDWVYHWEPTALGVVWLAMFLVCIRFDHLMRRIWRLHSAMFSNLDLLIQAAAHAGRR